MVTKQFLLVPLPTSWGWINQSKQHWTTKKLHNSHFPQTLYNKTWSLDLESENPQFLQISPSAALGHIPLGFWSSKSEKQWKVLLGLSQKCAPRRSLGWSDFLILITPKNSLGKFCWTTPSDFLGFEVDEAHNLMHDRYTSIQISGFTRTRYGW